MEKRLRVSLSLGLLGVGIAATLWRLNANQARPDPQFTLHQEVDCRAGDVEVPEDASRLALQQEPCEMIQGDVILPTETSGDAILEDEIHADSLRLGIETTLAGQINPAQFLRAALALSELEISKSPIPEPGPGGEMRYPILGTPDGVSAELCINRATSGKYSSPLMKYRLSVEPPVNYVFEGAARRTLDAQVYLWTDPQGNVDRFGVITFSSVDRGSREIGLGWDNRMIATGAHFSCNAKGFGDWSANSLGINNGVPYETAGTSVLGQVPKTEDLNKLKTGLLNQYGQL